MQMRRWWWRGQKGTEGWWRRWEAGRSWREDVAERPLLNWKRRGAMEVLELQGVGEEEPCSSGAFLPPAGSRRHATSFKALGQGSVPLAASPAVYPAFPVGLLGLRTR